MDPLLSFPPEAPRPRQERRGGVALAAALVVLGLSVGFGALQALHVV